MQSYRELVRFTGELDWKRERSLCVLLEPRSRKRSRAWRSILLFLRNYYPQSVIHFSIYIYILTRYYSYITSHRTSKYFFSQSSFETLSHPHSFQNVLTRFKNGTFWSLWQERYLNTFRNALRKYSKFVYGEKEAGREGVSCMDSRGICIYVCPSYREIRGRRGSLNEAWGMDPRQRQRPPRLYSN